MNVEGRTALVTGATGGLGQAIARALRARGASLVVSGRRGDVLDALAAEVGGRAVVADLADRADVDRLVAECGDVAVLVANAGVPADGPVLEYTAAQIDRALDVNLRAPVHLARVLAQPMVARGSGHVVFVSSLSGKVATANSALYSATKFGLRGFASGLRQDLLGTGVGVSCLFPGPIRDAGMFHDSGVELPRIAPTKSPQHVSAATLRAIERDVAEIDIASVGARAWGLVGQVAPGLMSWINGRFGGTEIAQALASSEAHRSKR
ncbi:MAG TPA: SDR family NAD(P)-dependent oxidoreductase [Solirubrobacteraceae bacterium]|nr:SDR family NAD(P)-dependent oxidoreductase [Solirubrobacteraceae bacterium]